MKDELLDLRQRLHINRAQIEEVVAKKHGIGDLISRSPGDHMRVRTLTEKLLAEWEEAKDEGGLDLDELGRFNELAAERSEINRQLRDIQGKQPKPPRHGAA